MAEDEYRKLRDEYLARSRRNARTMTAVLAAIGVGAVLFAVVFAVMLMLR